MVRTKKMAHKEKPTEHQSKRKKTGETSSGDLPSSWFLKDECRTKFLSDSNRSISLGYSLHQSFLDREGFTNLSNLLLFQNWTWPLTLFHEFDSTLIRLFYANFRIASRGDKFESLVYGKRVSISPRDILTFFYPDMDANSIEGVNIVDGNFAKIYPNYSHTFALRSLIDPSCTNPISTSVADLTLENRLLHHIVTRTVIPRSGSFSAVTPFDVGIMFLVKNSVKINLGSLMFYHMSKYNTSSYSSLPYGMFLTKFFLEFKEIPRVPSNTQSPDQKTSTYSKSTLSLLFKFDSVNEVWVRKFHVREAAASDIPGSSTGGHEAQIPEAQVPEFQAPEFPQNPDFFAQIMSRFDSMEASNAQILSRFDSLEASQAQILSSNAQIMSRFDSFEASNAQQYTTLEDHIRELSEKFSQSNPFNDFSHP